MVGNLTKNEGNSVGICLGVCTGRGEVGGWRLENGGGGGGGERGGFITYKLIFVEKVTT